jgi:16S rRNA (adenine1518-N6/adenine1519-N6)-dimethyltransferase
LGTHARAQRINLSSAALHRLIFFVRAHIPRRRFGQNFLVDQNYVRRILDAVAPKPGEHLLEIGPGQGALTAALIAGAGHLSAVEIDRDLAQALRQKFPSALTLFEEDALKFDFGRLEGNDWRVVGNLPYNIGSEILFRLLSARAQWRDIHVMLQKEVVQRMAAKPATPEYGRLSVMLQAFFAVKKLFVVPPGAFFPAPKIESAVARLTPLNDNAPLIGESFAALVAAGFSQRRKTLKNALASWCTPHDFVAADIDPAARAETLSVEDFARLSRITSLRSAKN